MTEETESFHLTPRFMSRRTSHLTLGQRFWSTSRPFLLSPFQELLVALIELIGSSLRELSHIIKRKLRHGGDEGGVVDAAVLDTRKTRPYFSNAVVEKRGDAGDCSVVGCCRVVVVVVGAGIRTVMMTCDRPSAGLYGVRKHISRAGNSNN
jgi:hypothetical protein